MTGWQWFWTLVGFLIFIVVLIFLYFYQPFEQLFEVVVYGLAYDNVMFWAALAIAIIGFCGYLWRAYRIHIVAERSVESMVLSALRGCTFAVILFAAGATLQAVQILCVYLLQAEQIIGPELGARLVAIIALVVLTGIFCIIFWLLKLVRSAQQA